MNEVTETPIRAARVAKGLSQKAAAEAIGFDQGGWSRIERGQQAPNPQTAFRIAALLGITIDEVLSHFRPLDTAAVHQEKAA